MKKMMKMLMGVSCALLAGTVAAADDPAWWLIAPDGSSTNEYSQINDAVQAAKSGSTILLTRDLTWLTPQDVSIKEDKTIAIDLGGHSLYTRSFYPDEPWTVTFQCPFNAVLFITNGKLTGDLKFVTQETPATCSVVLGSGLITDGNICAGKGYLSIHYAKVILTDGFESTYTNVFNTETPLQAMQGAKFAYPHNMDGVASFGALVFPNPYLQLVEQEDFTYVVAPASEPYLSDLTVAIIEDETLGTLRFPTLAAAVAAAKYGSTIIVIGDVTGENVKIPSGTTVRIGNGGKFREPKAKDLLYDYYMVKPNFDGGTVVGYEFILDENKVAPRVGDDSESETPWLEFVRDKKSGLVISALINIVNAYEGLYYGVDSGLSPTNLTRATKWMPVTERGSLRIAVPAAESGYFYRVRATDHIGDAMPDGSGFRLMAE